MKQWFSLMAHVLRALFLCVGLSACSANSSELVLVTKSGEYRFEVEIVDTDAARSKGLMYRTELAPNAGMLFDFKEVRPVSFWMRNTLIPLDMVFVAENGVVVNVHANAKPHDPTPIPSAAPVRFVFEIAGGRAKEIDLVAGSQLIHARIQR